MSEPFPELEVGAPDVAAADRKARLDVGGSVAILDTRARTVYETWHVDAPSATTANAPYFEFLDDVTDNLLEHVPDGDDLTAGSATISVMRTSGHTTGMTSHVVDDEPATAGDTLFVDSVARPANYEEIIATNRGRSQTNDDEAFELELGPNNCAAGE